MVVVHNAEAVGEDPHLHGAVGAAGEDVVGRSHLDLHHARAQVPEQRLAGVFVRKGVEGTLCGQTPHLNVPLGRSTDKAVLGWIDGQRFNRRVVALEALPLVPVGKLQDADPAFPPTCDKQLLPRGHREHGGTRLMAAESMYKTVSRSHQSIPQAHVSVVG